MLRVCEQCRTPFEAQRWSAVFCSGPCQSAAFRAAKAAELAAMNAQPARPLPVPEPVTEQPPAEPQPAVAPESRRGFVCRQDVSPQPWSDVAAWTYREDREPPYRSAVVEVFDDGSSPCSRCGLRHPWDQMLKREGLFLAAQMPMGWGQTAARQARDDRPVSSWDVAW